ncbi:MAG: hypothetical protein J5I90_13485 [Caldilineales bacterium]|nr:hypothetical protein [Caldilineales bacterium]
MRIRHLFLLFTSLALIVILAACGTPVVDQQADIDQAVEATLTVIASADGGQQGTPVPAEAQPTQTDEPTTSVQSTPTPRDPASIPAMVLPPLVNNFAPTARPAKTMGEPDAPVVLYEWSDYT